MFTGIVAETGTVRRARRRRSLMTIEVEVRPIARELEPGDSVALNGVCLTVTSVTRRRFSTQATRETLERTTLGRLEPGRRVNLELAARPTDRLGGHLVQGHVDGVARAVRIEQDDEARRVWWAPEADLLRYLVGKGSVAVEGVSLTVVEADSTTFQVSIVPHTLEQTTLGQMAVGSLANVEVDVIAKYVEKLTLGFNPRLR